MLQDPAPDDYVIGAGKSGSVCELLDVALTGAGLDWHGCVETDSAHTRSAEVPDLVADPTLGPITPALAPDPVLRCHDPGDAGERLGGRRARPGNRRPASGPALARRRQHPGIGGAQVGWP